MPNLDRRAAVLGLASLIAAPVLAQKTKPITLIVPTAPGGATDTVARMVADAWYPATGQAMVVNNRPGASGMIGAAEVARSPADGSVLLFSTQGMLLNPLTIKSVLADMLKDFEYIAGLAQSPFLLIANSTLPVKDVRELKAYALKNPDKISFAISDTSTRVGTELLLKTLGLKGLLVYFKGTSPSVTSVAGGFVSLTITTVTAALPMLQSGKAKVLGTLNTERLKLMPNVPTLTEQGFPVEYTSWLALNAPAGIQKAKLEELAAHALKIVKTPSFESKLESLSLTPFPLGPSELQAYAVQSMKKFTEVAVAAGIKPQ